MQIIGKGGSTKPVLVMQLQRGAPGKDVNCKNINFKSTNYVKFKGDNEEREDCTYHGGG